MKHYTITFSGNGTFIGRRAETLAEAEDIANALLWERPERTHLKIEIREVQPRNVRG